MCDGSDADEQFLGCRVPPTELFGAVGAHVARTECRGPALQLVVVVRDLGDAVDDDEREGCGFVVDGDAHARITLQRLSLHRSRAGGEDHVVAVEHEPHRRHVRAAVGTRGRDLRGAGAFHQEGAALVV